MKLLKNLSNLQKRIIGAGMLLIFGIVFFADLFLGGSNYLATGIYYIFSAGIIWELFSLFFKPKVKWNKTKYILFILSLIIYLGALFFIDIVNSYSHYYLSTLLLSVFFITITTDIGAYFIGKKFGKKKFAPKTSPNKTWAGFFGGIFFPVLIVIPFIIYRMILVDQLYMVYQVVPITAGVIILSIVAQLGDLFESYIKRLNGVKDSGKIIIGHGGLLDRFDGFLFLIFWIGIVIYIFGVN